MYTERPVLATPADPAPRFTCLAVIDAGAIVLASVIRRYDDERILGNDVADALEKVQAPEG